MWHRIDDPDNPPPKDGTVFQAWTVRTHDRKGEWHPRARYSADPKWNFGKLEVYGSYNGGSEFFAPSGVVETHWMPLPPPPAEDTP